MCVGDECGGGACGGHGVCGCGGDGCGRGSVAVAARELMVCDGDGTVCKYDEVASGGDVVCVVAAGCVVVCAVKCAGAVACADAMPGSSMRSVLAHACRCGRCGGGWRSCRIVLLLRVIVPRCCC